MILPIDPIGLAEQLKGATIQSPALSFSSVSPELADKFQSLMQPLNMVEPMTPIQPGPPMVAALVQSIDNQLINTVTNTMHFVQTSPMLSMGEITAKSIELSLEVASMQLDMQAKMGVVTSSKSAVETLMKNQ